VSWIFDEKEWAEIWMGLKVKRARMGGVLGFAHCWRKKKNAQGRVKRLIWCADRELGWELGLTGIKKRPLKYS